MSNASAMAALQAQIDRLHGIAHAPEEAAQAAAVALEHSLQRTVSAGQSPLGATWQLTATGKRPLRNAMASVTVQAIGTTLLATVRGATALHHLGAAAGRITRRVIPTKTLPREVREAIVKRIEDLLNG